MLPPDCRCWEHNLHHEQILFMGTEDLPAYQLIMAAQDVQRAEWLVVDSGGGGVKRGRWTTISFPASCRRCINMFCCLFDDSPRGKWKCARLLPSLTANNNGDGLVSAGLIIKLSR